MKRLLALLCAIGLITQATAGINATNGFYIGGDLSYAHYNAVKNSASKSRWVPLSGYVRPFIGIRFGDYFALEGGYSSIVNDSSKGGDKVIRMLGIESTTGPDHYRLYAFDFEGKFIYPFPLGFSLFAKLGGAYVHQDVYNQDYLGEPPAANSQVNKVLPLLGVGTSYNFNPNSAILLDYTHLQGRSGIGNIDTVALGLAYTF